ncbi:MAG TPA: hypothetical protein VE980_25010 [Pyrinomonadaceae bacterium]|nr:hypothetical protein [Pyrinomonadaceae bacterium]
MNKPVTFEQWLRSESGRIYVVISSLFTLIFSAFQVLKLFGIERIPIPTFPASDKGWLKVNYSIQVAFIAYVVFFTAYRFSKIKYAEKTTPNEETIWQKLELHDPASERHKENTEEYEAENQEAWIKFKQGANKVIKQFAWFWVLAWFSWLVHYIYLLVHSLDFLTTDVAVRNLLNNVNSLMFVFLFMTLTVSTSKYGALFWSKLLCSVLVMFGIELLSYRLSGRNEVVALAFTAISGLFASVALASFVGSINSKFINVPVWLIPILYLYVTLP